MASIRRRKFLATLGGAAAAWPLAARAQQAATPVIGFLGGGTPAGYAPYAAALRQGLKEAGYVEGQNVAIEFRWAEDQADRLPALAAELVRRPVAVLVGNTLGALAAKAVTATIPIVFASVTDPVKGGLVASLNRPGGNATGVYFFLADLGSKQVGLLRELLPAAARVGLLVNPTSPLTEPTTKDVTAAASAVGLKIDIVPGATAARSRLPSRRLCATGPTRSWSVLTDSCSAGACRSPPWRRATRFPPSITCASIRKPAA
jgi:putative ABC transport system substrate-binding protein